MGSLVAQFRHRGETSLSILQFQEAADDDGYDEDYIKVFLYFYKVGEREVVASRQVDICFGEVVTMERWPVDQLQVLLMKMGVPAASHPGIIASLLESINVRLFARVTLFTSIESTAVDQYAGLPEAELVDIVNEVTNLRNRLMRRRQQQLRASLFDFDAAVSASMEVDTVVRSAGASETEIASALVEVKQRGNGEALCCVICKDDEERREQFVRLPCSHVFHADCVVTWLRISTYCPLCRFSIST